MKFRFVWFFILLNTLFCTKAKFINVNYDLCLVKSNKTKIITNTCQSDGFGSQFQMIIASVMYAELNNKEYVYTPFKHMQHNYNNEDDFIAKKEWLINFIGNFPTIDMVDKNTSIIESNIYFKGFFGCQYSCMRK